MLGIIQYEASKKLPTPRDGLFNGFLFLLFILFHIFLLILLYLDCVVNSIKQIKHYPLLC